ncbi:dehydrogenase/reductase SDR family member 4-like isoform X1 [Acropora palmata]|uniref:dehydrogenase/reductase SDR family member 4-like isoform X1 n=2 Tax=Acropora palmata TaxID=6131 RepID=UPI003DA17820
MEMLQGVSKQHLRPCAVVGYGVKIFLPSPPNHVTRSPGLWTGVDECHTTLHKELRDVGRLVLVPPSSPMNRARLSLRASNLAVRMSCTAASNRTLEGKVAVVTASTEGIGLAIAKQLARDGAKVMISSRKQEKVNEAVLQLEKEEKGCSVKGVVCHVAKAEHRKNLIEQTLHHFGGIDILVSNAAANPVFGPILQTPEEGWDKIFDVNVKSAFLLAKDIIPLMEKKGSGSVIFISSLAAFRPQEYIGAYCVSKTALVGLTKVLAEECGHMGVRINCIAPGMIKTNFSEAFWKNDAVFKEFLKIVPLGRIGLSNDIGGAVSFLSSDQASYITGETLVISGGIHSRL